MFQVQFFISIGDENSPSLVSPQREYPLAPPSSDLGVQLTERVFGRCEDIHWNTVDNTYEMFVRVESRERSLREREHHREVLRELLREEGYDDHVQDDE